VRPLVASGLQHRGGARWGARAPRLLHLHAQLRRKVGDRVVQPLVHARARLPAQHGLGARDVGLALLRVVLRARQVPDLERLAALARQQVPDLLREREDGVFIRVADVDGEGALVRRAAAAGATTAAAGATTAAAGATTAAAGTTAAACRRILGRHLQAVVLAVHERHQPAHQVRHVLKGARLRAVAVHRQRLATQRLHDEVGYHAPIVRVHARPEGVEDAHDADGHAVLARVAVAERLAKPLALVVARPRAHRVHVSPIVLRLRVVLRVAVHLGGGREQQARPVALGELQHVSCAFAIRLNRAHHIALIQRRRCGAGQMVNHVARQADGLRYVVLEEGEGGVPQPVLDVADGPRLQAVYHGDRVPLRHQDVYEVGAHEAGAAGDDDALLLPCRQPRGGRKRFVRLAEVGRAQLCSGHNDGLVCGLELRLELGNLLPQRGHVRRVQHRVGARRPPSDWNSASKGPAAQEQGANAADNVASPLTLLRALPSRVVRCEIEPRASPLHRCKPSHWLAQCATRADVKSGSSNPREPPCHSQTADTDLATAAVHMRALRRSLLEWCATPVRRFGWHRKASKASQAPADGFELNSRNRTCACVAAGGHA